MSETEPQVFPGEPVATEIGRLKEQLYGLFKAKQQAEFEAQFPEAERKERLGGFEAFLKSPDGELALATLEMSCLGTALIVYLEAENRRRVAWEASVEERLRQALFSA